jgi:hypothetical protein
VVIGLKRIQITEFKSLHPNAAIHKYNDLLFSRTINKYLDLRR